MGMVMWEWIVKSFVNIFNGGGEGHYNSSYAVMFS